MTERTALVTGASGELGAAICRALAGDGLSVCAHYRNRRENAEKLAASLTEGGPRAFAFGADLEKAGAGKEAVEAVLSEFGRLDVVVNAAGGNRDVLMMMMKDEDFEGVLASNLKTAFAVCRAALKPMIERRGGRIINVASVSAWMGVAGQTNYAAAKAGLVGMTRALAAEVGRFGITVNAVAPGAVESEAMRAVSPERLKQVLAGIPLARLGRTEEVAAAVSFLASEKASYITGQVLAVSGGLG